MTLSSIHTFACGLALIMAAASCAAASRTAAECRLSEVLPRSVAPALADLSAAKAYRNYLAVSRVELPGYHFTVWYHHVEPVMMRLRVQRNDEGRLSIYSEGGYWGGLGVAPSFVRATPPEVAPLARDVETELRARCPSARGWKIQYGGKNRTVTLDEFIPHDLNGKGTRRVGWHATTKVAMDESLSQVISVIEEWSGFGVIELPADSHWITIDPDDGDKLILRWSGIQRLSKAIAEAARRFDSGAPALSLLSITSQDAPMLPPGFVSRVTVTVSLYGRTTRGNGSSNHDLLASLDLHDAVFGTGAAADASIDLGKVRYRLHATLAPNAPRSPTPERTSATYAGMLTLHIDDGHGHTWERAYPTTGRIELEGDQIVAPFGLEIPGASGPSPEWDARHGRLPGLPPYDAVDLYVNVSLFDDPRR